MESEITARSFRSPESIESERATRAMLPDFLARRGYAIVSDKAVRNGQTIVAATPNGDSLTMRVRLCWRREGAGRDSPRGKTISAAQLLADIGKDDWLDSLRKKVDRERSEGATHFLFVQNEGQHILYAALVPLTALLPIWIAQREASARLIAQGLLGRRKQNHATNGRSPMLYLQDDHAPDVAAALWNYPGVRDLAKIEPDSGGFVSLPDEEADRTAFGSDMKYVPADCDQRQEVECQIRERRGQQHFRDVLRERFGDRCLVTGCTVLAVLEAAHIKPYRGENDNHPENGLLLRSDVHTLFDLDLVGIEPVHLQVKVHPSVMQEYGYLAGQVLGCASARRPSHTALSLRYEQFRRRLHRRD